MTYHAFCGWDVSKLNLNYCLIQKDGTVVQEGRIRNTTAAIQRLLTSFYRQADLSVDTLLHCAENTGQYSNPLRRASSVHGLALWEEDAFQLNRSLGRQRDKNDVVDAGRIADYARRHADRAKMYQMASDFDPKLSQLVKYRDHLVDSLQHSKTMHREAQDFQLVALSTDDEQIFVDHIAEMKRRLELIEQAIERHLEQADEEDTR